MHSSTLARDILLYGTGEVLLRGAALITLPVYTRVFSPEEYGVWMFVLTIGGLFTSLLLLGGDSAYMRWFFTVDEARRPVLTSTWLIFLGLWSSGVVLMCLPLAPLFSRWSFGVADRAALFVLALLTAPPAILSVICAQALRNRFAAGRFIVHNLLLTCISVGVSLGLVFGLRLGIAALFWGPLTAVMIMLPVRLGAVRDLLVPRFSRQFLGRLLTYGLPLVPATVASWIFVSSDRIVLGKLATLDDVGLYAVAATLTGVLVLLQGAFSQAWSPHAFDRHARDPEDASRFAGRVLTVIVLIFGMLGVVLSVWAPELLRLLTTEHYAPAALVIGPLCLGAMAQAGTQVSALNISLSGKTGYLAVCTSLAATLNLGLNLLLIPRWGMLAAAWTTALAYTFMTVSCGLISRRLGPFHLETRRLPVIVTLSAGVIIITPQLNIGPGIKTLVCLAYVAGLLAGGALGRREWDLLRSLMPAR